MFKTLITDTPINKPPVYPILNRHVVAKALESLICDYEGEPFNPPIAKKLQDQILFTLQFHGLVDVEEVKKPQEPGLVEWHDLISSDVKRVSHNSAKRELLVIFVSNGKCYRYFDVGDELLEGLKNAPSAGRYFNSYVKGVYNFERAPEFDEK